MAEARRRFKEFPPWLKKPLPVRYDSRTQGILAGLRLNTVCLSAECPNIGECWSGGAATFMLLGEFCTRGCGFCATRKAQRGEEPAKLADEPERVAEAAQQLKLKYVVLTSVSRDDLPDEGAGHFARTIEALRRHCGSDVQIEVLTPDFHGREDCLRAVVAAGPTVFNHNVETVERLYPAVRPQADYRRTLNVLRLVKTLAPALPVKSGLMVGLGETRAEVQICQADLRTAGCSILTLGQYLQPSPRHLPVVEHVEPAVFKAYEQHALALGFSAAACGPFVRSSYQAEEVLNRSAHRGDAETQRME